MAEQAVVEQDRNQDSASESNSQNAELRAATERAEQAEAELARLKSERSGASPAADGQRDSTPSGPSSAPNSEAHAAQSVELQGVEALRQDSMMKYLLDSLHAGKDIGHYGRLVFCMVARHFMGEDEVIGELTKDPDFSAEQAEAMLRQVSERDYNPPRRERILEWQSEQEFPILPEPHDPDCGNVYRSLRFPTKTYKHIEHYQEERSEA